MSYSPDRDYEPMDGEFDLEDAYPPNETLNVEDDQEQPHINLEIPNEQEETPSAPQNPPDEIDTSIYHPSIPEELYLDMKKNRPRNWDDPAWKYAAQVPKQKGAVTQGIKCLLCGFVSTGGIHRIKLHIARINPSGHKLGVVGCPNAPMRIREELKQVLEAKIASRKPPIVEVELLSSTKGKGKMTMSGAGSSSSVKKVVDCGKMKVIGPLGLEKDQTLHDIVRSRRSQGQKQTTIADHMKKEEKAIVDQCGGKFFITSGVPFNVSLNADLAVS